MKNFLLFTCLLMNSIAVAQTQPKKIEMHNSPKAMQQELEKKIPIGSSIIDAQQILQANGFACSMKNQQSFIEVNDKNAVVEHKNIDFLFCDKQDRLLINARFWQVAVVHQNNLVSAIF